MVTPGIEPEQVAIDLGPFAQHKEMKLALFGQWPGYMNTWQPSHWAIENRRIEFRIMQVAGYKRVFDTPDTKADVVLMQNLEAAVKPEAKIPADFRFPYPEFGDAGLTFSTHPQVLVGDGWRGLRFVGAVTNDTGCSSFGSGSPPHLVYFFEGISDDGRFFILMRAWASNPQLERRLGKECTAGAKAANPEADPFLKNEMPALFDREISSADPASFQPSLDQLDAVIRSLKLQR